MEHLPPTTDLLRCPRCRAFRGFHAVSLQEDSSAGCLFFFLGGIIPYLIYSSQRSNLIECENCHLVFRPPSPPINGKVAWFVIIAVIIGFAVLAWLGNATSSP